MKYSSGVRQSSKEELSGKLATLLALLWGQKVTEILSVIDYKNV